MAVGKVARSISFPAPKLSAASAASSAAATSGRRKKTSYRTRSTSLPTRLHPLAAHIDAELDAIHSWSATPAPASASWLAQGFDLLHLLLAALSDLLLLPQALDPLRRLHNQTSSSSASFADRLLDDLLRLADAHAAFRSAALDLRHLLSSALSALRRPSPSAAHLSAAARSRRRAERDVARAASSVRDVGRRLLPVLAAADAEEAEVAVVVREAVAAAATASAALFAGIVSMSAAVAAAAQPPHASCGWVEAALRWRARAKARALQKKMKSAPCTQEDEAAKKVPEEEGGGQAAEKDWRVAAMEKVAAMEECVRAAEDGGEKVFRDLVNTRVALLNVLTPTF